jgi:hypothetical protein
MKSPRIGGRLVRAGLISAADLKIALQSQVARGGFLGTNLLELGMIDERGLGPMLAERWNTRYASPEMLAELPSDIGRQFPRWLAMKHRAAPVRCDRESVDLLVVDPRRLSGLSTQTGLRVVPWIAPHVRVAQTLQRLYGVPLNQRNADLLERLDRPDEVRESDDSSERLSQQLCDVDSGALAVRVTLDAAAERLAHVVLFRVRDNTASVWDERGSARNPDELAAVELPVRSGSLLELLSIYPHFVGRAPTDPGCEKFFEEIGVEFPREMLLAPLRVNQHLVGILYGDAGPDGTLGDSRPLLELANKLALALTLVVVKKKICA